MSFPNRRTKQKVVTRSPDLATVLTAGLRSLAKKGDLRSSRRRGRRPARTEVEDLVRPTSGPTALTAGLRQWAPEGDLRSG